jgi:hypothetical protein
VPGDRVGDAGADQALVADQQDPPPAEALDLGAEAGEAARAVEDLGRCSEGVERFRRRCQGITSIECIQPYASACLSRLVGRPKRVNRDRS